MTDILAFPSLLEVSQHDLARFLSPSEKVDPGLSHAVARACLPHCIAASREITAGAPSDERFANLLRFVKQHGAKGEASEVEAQYYSEGIGWKHIPIADRCRRLGETVVSQNLLFGLDTDIGLAQRAGRVRSQAEAGILSDRASYGGDRGQWIEAMSRTLAEGGAPIPLIGIPLMNGRGKGGHTVLVTNIDSQHVTYFDPDMHNVMRYDTNNMAIPEIERVDPYKLVFRQTNDDFLERMTGELVHHFSNSPQ